LSAIGNNGFSKEDLNTAEGANTSRSAMRYWKGAMKTYKDTGQPVTKVTAKHPNLNETKYFFEKKRIVPIKKHKIFTKYG
jgi:hypothetical protein